MGCCLPDYDLGFQWKRTAHNHYDEAPCSELHSSFSDTKVRRRCRSDDSWEPADISSCTFKNSTRNPIYLLTTSVVVSGGQDRSRVIQDIQRTFESQVSWIVVHILLANIIKLFTLMVLNFFLIHSCPISPKRHH